MFTHAGIASAKKAHFQSYGGWATTDGAVVLGRVVEGSRPSGKHRTKRWKKLASSAKAFVRGDVEHADLVVTDPATGQKVTARTDDEGFYDVRIPGPLAAGAHTFRVELVGSKYQPPALEVSLDAVDPQAAGHFAVVDIDDTLTDTGVTGGKLKVGLSTAGKDAGDMHPFPASNATLAALAARGVPIIYVSASPVQLAPRLAQFLAERGYPPGALLLRYWPEDGMGDPRAFKRRLIDRLLADFPKRKLLLFGDNGEQDPELFAAIAKDTGRVEAAYVRATLPVQAGDPRYDGLVTFEDWRQVARDAGRRKLIRWTTASRIATSKDP